MPPDVTAALRRLQGGAGTDADKQILAAWMDQNQGSLSPDDLLTIRSAIMVPTGAGVQAPIPPTVNPPTDWRSMVEGWGQGLGQTVAQGAFGPATPTPSPSTDWGQHVPPTDQPPTGGLDWGGMLNAARQAVAPTEPIAPITERGGQLAGQSPSFVSPAGGLTNRGASPDTPPVPMGNTDWKQYDPTVIGGPLPAPGVTVPGVSSPGQEQLVQRIREQEQRRQAHGRGDRGGNGGASEDWRGQAQGLGFDPSSAFFGSNPDLAGLYANDPYLAALQMHDGSPQAAAAYAPQMQSAMALARMGVVSGKDRRHGLGAGGTDEPVSTLTQAENWLNSLPEGQAINPGETYHDAFRRVMRTPKEGFASSEGQPGDYRNQISISNGALLASGGFMDQESYATLKARLEFAATQWLGEVAQGSQETYPQFLKKQGVVHWVSRSG